MLAPRECCTKCHSRTFVSNVLRLCTKDEMQGAEDVAEGSVLTYVTETEFRKQRSRSPSCNSRSIGIGHPRSGDRCANTRLNPLDPLRVAEQKFPFPAPPSGRRIPQASLIVRCPNGFEDCLRCPVHGSSGLHPSTSGYKASTLVGVHRSPLFTMS